jgi:hypothetical protein
VLSGPGYVGDARTYRDPVRFRTTDWGVSTEPHCLRQLT